MLARTALPLVALAAACGTRPAPLAPPPVASPPVASPAAPAIESLTPAQLREAWQRASPAGRAAFEAALVARLTAEAGARAHPSSGLVSERTLAQADAIVDEVVLSARPALARAMVAWLIERAWAYGDSRGPMRRAAAVLGDAAYDAVAAASERDDAAYGLPSWMLYADEPGRDALLARLIPRARSAFDAARDVASDGQRVAPGDPPHERVARLLRLLEALDRPEPVHRFLLEVLGDDAMPAALRVAALNGMTRSNLPLVAPALLAVAARPGDEEVRLQVVARLGAMTEQVASARLAALYESTPRGPSGAALRGRVGAELVRRGWPAARAAVLRWARRSDAWRAGRAEADAWSRAFAGCGPLPDALWRDPAPEVRALAVFAWSWTHQRGDADRVRALAYDRAPLANPSWGATVGAVARGALAGRPRDPSIALACCCVGE